LHSSEQIVINAGTNLLFYTDNDNAWYTDADGNSRFTMRSGSVAFQEWQDDDSMVWGSGSSVNMTLDKAGNLGIGTTAPATKLDVVGVVRQDREFFDGSASTPTGDATKHTYIIHADAFGRGTNTTVTMTLPASPVDGQEHQIIALAKGGDPGGGTVTGQVNIIAPAGAFLNGGEAATATISEDNAAGAGGTGEYRIARVFYSSDLSTWVCGVMSEPA